jgi:Domain of unknown function (DUF4351)
MLHFGDIEHTVLGQDLISIGRERGREEGITSILLRQATRRFGAPSDHLRSQIEDLDYLQLEALADSILDFSALGDLEAWLAAQPKRNRPRGLLT